MKADLAAFDRASNRLEIAKMLRITHAAQLLPLGPIFLLSCTDDGPPMAWVSIVGLWSWGA